MAYTLLAAKDIEVGDLVDLEFDQYANPSGDNAYFESEYGEVVDIEVELDGSCITIYFEGFDGVGFPPYHILYVTQRGVV